MSERLKLVIVWIYSIVFGLTVFVSYRWGKGSADRWYFNKAKDCTWEGGEPTKEELGGLGWKVHYVCRWESWPKTRTIVISNNPQILLDTVTSPGCAHVLIEENKIYLQGVEGVDCKRGRQP